MRKSKNDLEHAKLVGVKPTGEPDFYDLSNPETVFEMMSRALWSFTSGELERQDAEMIRKFAESAFRGHATIGKQDNELKAILLSMAEVQPNRNPERVEPEEENVSGEAETIQ